MYVLEQAVAVMLMPVGPVVLAVADLKMILGNEGCEFIGSGISPVIVTLAYMIANKLVTVEFLHKLRVIEAAQQIVDLVAVYIPAPGVDDLVGRRIRLIVADL